jgi:hypothetical protein
MLDEPLSTFDFLSDACVVGGAVRDALIGRDSDDIDLATSDRPEEVMEKCSSRGIRTIETGIEHGTVTALVGDSEFEITTFRRDVSTDGRNATVEFADSIQEDLKRRDFTINAMAYDGGLIDPFGGQEDLEAEVIKTVGGPRFRFREDFLRIIRAVRFAARYGFDIYGTEREAMEDLAPEVMENVSVERVVMEIEKAMKDTHPSKFLNDPEFQTVISDAVGVGFGAHFSPICRITRPRDRFIFFLHKLKRETGLEFPEIRDRMKLPNALVRDAEAFHRAVGRALDLSGDVEERKFLADFPDDHVHRILSQKFDVEIESDIRTEPIVTGQTFIDRGVEEGPQIGDLVDEAHRIQLEEGITDESELADRAMKSL